MNKPHLRHDRYYRFWIDGYHIMAETGDGYHQSICMPYIEAEKAAAMRSFINNLAAGGAMCLELDKTFKWNAVSGRGIEIETIRQMMEECTGEKQYARA